VTYQDSKGNVIKTIEGNEGDDLLSLAHEHDIDLEGELWFPYKPSSSTLYCRHPFNTEDRALEQKTKC
jgi:hypothetical protein